MVTQAKPSDRRSCKLLLVIFIFSIYFGMAASSHAAVEGGPCTPEPTDMTISYGSVVTCAIGAVSDTDTFRFEGASGEVVNIVMTRTSGSGDVCLELIDPLGAPVSKIACSDTRFGGVPTAGMTAPAPILPRTGTYTIVISEGGNDATLQYNLSLERINSPSPNAGSIAVGQVLADEINPATDRDLFIFTGFQGQSITAVVNRTGGSGEPCLLLYDPNALLRGNCADARLGIHTARLDVTLTASGTYVIMVEEDGDDATIQYSLELRCVSQCAPPPPPNLTQCLSPRSLNVAALVGAAPQQRTIQLGESNLSNCAFNVIAPYTTSVTFLNGSGWLLISPVSGTFFPGLVNTITATVNPAALGGAGTYQAQIQISVPSLNRTLSVPVTVTLNSARPQLSLSWNAFAFQTVEQTSAPPPQTVRIYDGVPGTVDWTISPVDPTAFPTWLNISPLAGTAGAVAGQGNPVTITVNPAGLTAGAANTVYNALVKVTSANASNSPEYVSITFHVVRSTAAPTPLLTAYGMVFNLTQGGPAPPAQSFTFSNTGGGSITAAVARSTTTGGNWLSVSKATSTTSGGPDTIQASVNPAGVPVGLHRGKITFTFTTSTAASRAPQDVDVLLIVTPAGPIASQRSGEAAAVCAPTRMDVVGATLGNGLNIPVSFPQVLLAQVVDDCGQAVTGATVVAVAEGNSIPLSEVGGGLYSGMFTPQKASSSSPISVSAFHPSFASVLQTFTVVTANASGNTLLPTLFNQGVVEGAGFSQGRPLVPGGIISLFGANLAPSIAVASVIPLERQLAQTSVRIGNVNAPLYFVSPDQINAQLPFESVPGDTVSIIVTSGGKLTTPQLYQISPAQPGIFKTTTDAAVLDEFFQLITPQNPARIGKVIQIFSNGLGVTNPPVATGAGSPAFSNVQIPVTVTIGGVQASVGYQGLAPNFVGLYQVNVTVPQGVAPGSAVPIVIRQNGIPSNPDLPVTLPVAQ